MNSFNDVIRSIFRRAGLYRKGRFIVVYALVFGVALGCAPLLVHFLRGTPVNDLPQVAGLTTLYIAACTVVGAVCGFFYWSFLQSARKAQGS